MSKKTRRKPVHRTPEQRKAMRRHADAADSFTLAARAAREGDVETARGHAREAETCMQDGLRLAPSQPQPEPDAEG
jgi:hypothetical protein